MTRRTLSPRDGSLGLWALGLLMLGLFWNLGLPALWMEEPRRALVALEMALSGDYIVPHSFGLPYHNKPPLFNWVQLGMASAFGWNEFALRLSSALSLLGMGLLLFWAGRRYVSARFGLFSALLFVTGKEVFFFFSALGEIDLFFGLLVLAQILAIFHFGEKRQWWLFYLITYLLCALATMTKGLPAFAFQGITLLTYLLWARQIKRLFHPAHLAGLAVLAGLVGGYLWVYSGRAELTDLLNNLWHEASDRTAHAHTGAELIEHFLSFPFLLAISLMPGTVFLLLALKKGTHVRLLENRYVTFGLLVFCANFPLYWLSPEARERYLFPLSALLLGGLAFLADRALEETPDWRRRALEVLSLVVILGVGLGGLIGALLLTNEATEGISKTNFLILGLCGLRAAVMVGWGRRWPKQRLLLILIAVLASRVVFDAVVLPLRALPTDKASIEKQVAHDLVEVLDGRMAVTYKGELSHRTAFYYSLESRQVLGKRTDFMDNSLLYLVEDQDLPALDLLSYRTLFTFPNNNWAEFSVVEVR